MPHRLGGKMAKLVCSCHGTWCFQKNTTEGRAQRVKGRRREGKKSSERVWWPHVTLVAKCFGIAGCDAKH